MMRIWQVLLGALLLTVALGIIGCGGTTTTPGTLGTVRVQGTQLIYTPAADIAGTLEGNVTATFTSSGASASIPNVLMSHISGSSDWVLNFADPTAFTTVLAGTYSGIYTAQVKIFQVGKGSVDVPSAQTVTLNLTIGGGGINPPPPPNW